MILDLDALKFIAQAATPGPWKSDVWNETDGYGWRATGPHHEDNIDPMGSEPGCPEERAAQRDAAHIAAFPPDVVLALIAKIERLRKLLRDATCPFDSTPESRAELRKREGL